MELPSFIDEEVFYSPAFWIIGSMIMIGFLIGFKATGVWSGGTEQIGIHIYIKILLLVCSWLIAYGWIWKLK